MTRNTFKAYLRKVQKLQVLAYEHGLNFCFGTRDTETNANWITGYIYPEGTDFVHDKEGDVHIGFYLYEWQDRKRWDAELARVEKWILEHGVEIGK